MALTTAYTRNATNENLIHNDDGGLRMLTPTECERLQGFPDGWTEGLSSTRRRKLLGNAVPVPVVEWIARRLTPFAMEAP